MENDCNLKARYKRSQIKEVVESLKQYNVTCDVTGVPISL
jgi:hypothetical protein